MYSRLLMLQPNVEPWSLSGKKKNLGLSEEKKKNLGLSQEKNLQSSVNYSNRAAKTIMEKCQ